MTPDLLDLLVCTACRSDRGLLIEVSERSGDEIISGDLVCPACASKYPVIGGIPRFVGRAENYAENFTFEWQRWGHVQIDKLAGHSLSARRFLAVTKWPKEWLDGKLLLDAGCGAGRFTDVAAAHGARVIAVDLSGAVEAARENTVGYGGRVEVVQASLTALPFRRSTFDGVFCMGVIQHTPDPAAVMSALPAVVRPGGYLAYDFYEITWLTKLQPIKYALRRLTRHLSNAANHSLAVALVALFFPLSWILSRIRYARFLNIMLPMCAVHSPELTLRQQVVWTVLDTFDWYSPRYEIRQSHQEVASLLRRVGGLAEVESEPGIARAVAVT
jgi:2-polyprenyl-3-methyl-5-hydroxy-6-metoxy-1,4-benzoquinol methylase/uncharacterized protein YbaR (Trm112 family)